MTQITNPILRGFNPDPSIIYSDGYYYIATSTFQWFPGVQIHRSRDLANWEFVTRPLDDVKKLNMYGIPDSGGVWAPCLTYDKGTFYLIYTIVRSLEGIFKDTDNYLVTAPSIEGPWSEPKFLNSLGFDPSLFHQNNGRKYLLNTLWDHRPWMENFFYGITIQEFDFDNIKPLGEAKMIFKGTGQKLTEGPHLYQKDDFYYLFTAEGGTRSSHAETVCRSRDLFGPYEVHPENPFITSKNYPDLRLQNSGHGDIIQGRDGQWYFVHLTSRPGICGNNSVLGRETAIQKVDWPVGDWPRLSSGGNEPAEVIEISGDSIQKDQDPVTEYSFDEKVLHNDFQSLRIPSHDLYSLSERKGWLRIFGGESMSSLFRQSLLAVRQDNPVFDVSVSLDMDPDSFHHMAGLAAYYDTKSFYYLHISRDEWRGRVLHLLTATKNGLQYPQFNIPITEKGTINLRYRVDKGFIQFYYSINKTTWIEVGDKMSMDVLSDEYTEDFRFTGAFAALACQDLSGNKKFGDFSCFNIKRL
ncbi:MAG: glycoside hydrolase family 43 protein [Spirochaetaceae bacterium]|nr:glycoside hydrolase family 43 protein [Spirochaetaceae bacterium]